MAIKKVIGKDAEMLTLNFEVSREMFDASSPQLDALLIRDGLDSSYLTQPLSYSRVLPDSMKRTDKKRCS